jgi:lysophospholipase L1-like esterase
LLAYGCAAAIGGAGMFQTYQGRRVPDAAEPFLRRQRYDMVVVLVGINDLLAGGRKADEVMGALQGLYKRIADTGANILAVSPLGAPGFASR